MTRTTTRTIRATHAIWAKVDDDAMRCGVTANQVVVQQLQRPIDPLSVVTAGLHEAVAAGRDYSRIAGFTTDGKPLKGGGPQPKGKRA